MKKRVLSLFTALALCFSLLPVGAWAEDSESGTQYVAKIGDTKYKTLEDALGVMSEDTITLLGNVEETELSVYAATTIEMEGFSITGDIDATDSLTLSNGTVIGNVVVDMAGGNFNMTAPDTADAAIDGGLEIIDGSCSISGAKIGVKGTLYEDGDDFTVTGTDKAVLLNSEAEPKSKTLYGSATVDGDASVEAVFDTDTYKVNGEVAKKLSNQQQGGSSNPDPAAELTLTPDSKEIYAGESAEFTVTYNGTDDLEVKMQKNALEDNINAEIESTGTANEYKVTVTTTNKLEAGLYTLFVYEKSNPANSKKANVTVTNAVAKDSDGNYYEDMKTAITSAADGSTVTVIAKANQLSLPDGIYVERADKGITLDLNGHSLDGSPINVGGVTVINKPRPGKLTVIDSEGGNGAVGIMVRNNGTFIFSPGNEHTTLLQLQVYGGDIVLNSGKISSNGLHLSNDITLDSLLPANKGLAYRGAIHYTTWIPMTSTQNKAYQPPYDLVVTKCEHKGFDSDGKCLYCGAACIHSNGFTDGKCNDCGEPCPHTNINEATAACSTCGMKMSVKAEKKDGTVRYGTLLGNMMNEAEDGETFTLLADAEFGDNAKIYGNNKTITLDLNGHSATEQYRTDVIWISDDSSQSGGGKTGKLIIKGEGTVMPNLAVYKNGEVDLSGCKETTIDCLSIYEETSITGISDTIHINKLWLNGWETDVIDVIKLSGGSYGEIFWNNFKDIDLPLGNLLAPGYTFQREDNTFASYTDKLYANGTRTINNVKVVKCENHAVSDSDGKCAYCNTQFEASIVDSDGTVYKYCTDLEDAINTQLALGGEYTVKLLIELGIGSTLQLSKGSPRIDLNGKTVGTLWITDSCRATILGDGMVQSIAVDGNQAGLAAAAPAVSQMIISKGATWSSILPPDDSDGYPYGYKVFDDTGAYKWYNRNTIETIQQYFLEGTLYVKKVSIQPLPIKGEPILMLGDEEVKQGHVVSNKARLIFSVKMPYTPDAKCYIYRESSKDTILPEEQELYNDGRYRSVFNGTYLGRTGTHKYWAVVSKDGYECKTEVFDIICKQDLADEKIKINLKPYDFTYTPQPDGDAKEFRAEIESVTLPDGKTLPADAYEVSGDTGKEAKDYTISITAKENSDYVGTGTTTWKIKPLTLTDIVPCVEVKNYDGTTDITADDIGKNAVAPYFLYGGGSENITLEYGADKDYYIYEDDYVKVEGDFPDANGNTHGNVTFVVVLKNSNYTFMDENNNKSQYKTFTKGMNIGKADLPADCTPNVGELTVRNGTEHTYTYDVSSLLKSLPNPQEYCITNYRLVELSSNTSLISLDDSYYTKDAASIDENGNLKLPIKAVNTEDEKNIGTVKVKVISKNYKDFYITINVKAENKIEPKGSSEISRKEITYGEPIGNVVLSGKMYDEVNKCEVDGEFVWNGDPKFVPDAGILLIGWKFEPKDPVTYKTVYGQWKIKVNKANIPAEAITPPAANGNLEYNGTAQELITAGSATSGEIEYGTMEYRIGKDGAWSTELPKATNAGSYEVYYRVAGDSNHLNAEDDNMKIVCNIEKYKITYDLECKSKTYDNSVNAELKEIKFFGTDTSGKEINLTKDTDYIIKSINYDDKNVGGNLGTERIGATATIELNGIAAINYELDNSKAKAFGYITPAQIENIESYSSYTEKICYSNTFARLVTATAFGAQDRTNYVIVSDMVLEGESSILDRNTTQPENGGIKYAIAQGLGFNDVGKSCTIKLRIYTKDYNYCTDELSLTVEIADRGKPVLSVNNDNNDIKRVYDGTAVSTAELNANCTATVNGHKIDGNFYFVNKAPVNVSQSNTYEVVFKPEATGYYYDDVTIMVNVKIIPRDINSGVDLSLDNYSFTYDRNEQRANVKAAFNETPLAKNTDYTLTFPEDITNAGEKQVKITGIGNFKDEAQLTYTIGSKELTDPTAEIIGDNFVYTGSAITPDVKVKDGDFELTRDTDYTVIYKNNENAGTATVEFTGIGNYQFQKTETFTIEKAAAQFTTAPGAVDGLIYNGTEQTLITKGSTNAGTVEYRLGENGEWQTELPKAQNAGSYNVYYRIVGDDNHNGTAEQSIAISIGQKDIADARITLGDGLTYNRNEQTQSITSVTVGGLEVTYTVSGNTAVNAGDYTMTIVGNGNFKGETTKNFTVARKTVKADVTVNGTYTYNANAIEPTDIVVKDGEAVIPVDEYTVSYANNTNAGTATVTISNKDVGNYTVSGTGTFVIDKANITVKPKDVSKEYGEDNPKFELVSGSSLITPEELAKFAETATFTSDGIWKTAHVRENGYEISAQLTNNETDNLILTVDGTGVLTVTKAPLTVTVKNVSREYGAENPPLEVVYSEFKNGEDESVLGGELKLSYDSSVNEQSKVDTYPGAAKAEGLNSGNYEISYVYGDVEIYKIPVNVSVGTARTTYLEVLLDRNIPGLEKGNFAVYDSENKLVTITRSEALSDGESYILSGVFEANKKYTVSVVLSGTAADATHRIVNDKSEFVPVSMGGSLGAQVYTITFDTNGGSDISSRKVMVNSTIKEPEAPTKEGFDFAGWYKDKNLETKYDFSEKVTRSITLYAAWTKKDSSDISGDSDNRIILTIGEKEAKVFGTTKLNDVAPKIVNDRTMLPARFVAENLGARVSWDEEKRLVTITGKQLKTGDDITILIYIDSDIAYVNGKEIKLDSPAFIENDRTYTPVRFVAEELGADVEWVESELKVVITSTKK